MEDRKAKDPKKLGFIGKNRKYEKKIGPKPPRWGKRRDRSRKSENALKNKTKTKMLFA